MLTSALLLLGILVTTRFWVTTHTEPAVVGPGTPEVVPGV
jgi:hypothetical protein